MISPSGLNAIYFSGKTSQLPVAQTDPVAGLFSHRDVFEPLLQGHGAELLQEAVQGYVDAQTSPEQGVAHSWVRQLLNRLPSLKELKPEQNFKVVAPVLRENKQRLAQLLQSHGANVPAVQSVLDAQDAVDRALMRRSFDQASTDQLVRLLRNTGKTPGLDLNRRHPATGATLLHLPVMTNHQELVQVLLEAGADANQANQFGITPLWHAAQFGHLPIVAALLAAGANVNQANNWGFTPLTSAAQWGHLSTVQALLAAGADVSLKDTSGKTALDWATDNHHQDIITLLQQHVG